MFTEEPSCANSIRTPWLSLQSTRFAKVSPTFSWYRSRLRLVLGRAAVHTNRSVVPYLYLPKGQYSDTSVRGIARLDPRMDTLCGIDV